ISWSFVIRHVGALLLDESSQFRVVLGCDFRFSRQLRWVIGLVVGNTGKHLSPERNRALFATTATRLPGVLECYPRGALGDHSEGDACCLRNIPSRGAEGRLTALLQVFPDADLGFSSGYPLPNRLLFGGDRLRGYCRLGARLNIRPSGHPPC